MSALQWYDRWLLVLIPAIFVLGTYAGCAGPPDESQVMIDARWHERNVAVQRRVVPGFQEVWYKHHLYVILSREGSRKGMLAHAGHCPGLHVTRIGIGGEQQ